MFTNISSSQFHKVFHKVSQSFWEIYIFNKISFVLGIKGFRVSESRIIITHRRPPSSRGTWPSFLALVPNIALNPLNYRSSIKHVSHCCRVRAAIKTRYPTRKNVTKGMQEVTLQEVSQFLTAFFSSPLSNLLSLPLFTYKTNVQTKETSRINTSLRVAWRALLFPTYPVHVLFPRCRI